MRAMTAVFFLATMASFAAADGQASPTPVQPVMPAEARPAPAEPGRSSATGEIFAFSQKPRLARDGDGWIVTFASKGRCDAAVAVVDRDGRIVRHLAAGLLGPDAPEPFQKDSLAQSLVWDGRDDAGKPVAAGCKVRVRLGLKPEFGGLLGWDGLSFGSIRGLAVDAGGTCATRPSGMAQEKGSDTLSPKRERVSDPAMPESHVAHGGTLYVLSSLGNRCVRITAVSREGKYLRTLLPHAANLPPDRLKGLDFLDLADGRRVPRIVELPKFAPQVIYPQTLGIPRQSMALTPDGRLLLVGAGDPVTGFQNLLQLRTDGGVPEPLVGPRLWKSFGKRGYLALTPDGRLLISGSVLGSDVLRLALSGGPDKAERLCTVGSPKGKGEPRGLAVDAAGRLYVADAANGAVAVFDREGKPLRTLAAPGACQVGVHPRTGAVYVLCHSPGRLIKLAGLDAEEPEKVLADMEVAEINRDLLVMALDGSAAPAAVWFTPDAKTLWRVEDAGETFKKTMQVVGDGFTFVSQVTLDRARGELYVKVSLEGKIERVDTRTGARHLLPVQACDMYVGPDGHLYTTGGPLDEPLTRYPQFVRRYDREGRQVPFPGGAAEIRVETWRRSPDRSDVGRGLFVAPDGRIFVACYDAFNNRSYRPGPVRVFAFSPEGKSLGPAIVYGLPQGSSGLAVDRAGNIYVGAAVKPKGKAGPDVLAGYATRLPGTAQEKGSDTLSAKPETVSDPAVPGNRVAHLTGTKGVPLEVNGKPWRLPSGHVNWYFGGSGCLFKFAPAGGRFWWEAMRKMEQPPEVEGPDDWWRLREFEAAPVRVQGAEWSRFAISPQTQGGGGVFFTAPDVYCNCRTMRLDMDGYGRVYAPDALTFSACVFDAAGNQLARIGSYGNADSRGPGSPAPDPEIGLSDLRFLAASDEELYLSDEGNSRVVRVRLSAHAEAEEAVPLP